eukprot:4010556-Alexandrium_andersonii.AAC.1
MYAASRAAQQVAYRRSDQLCAVTAPVEALQRAQSGPATGASERKALFPGANKPCLRTPSCQGQVVQAFATDCASAFVGCTVHPDSSEQRDAVVCDKLRGSAGPVCLSAHELVGLVRGDDFVLSLIHI